MTKVPYTAVGSAGKIIFDYVIRQVSIYLQPLSQLSRQNEIHNQKFHTWRKRSALDIVYYRLWSARQKSLSDGEKTLQRRYGPIECANGIIKGERQTHS